MTDPLDPRATCRPWQCGAAGMGGERVRARVSLSNGLGRCWINEESYEQVQDLRAGCAAWCRENPR